MSKIILRNDPAKKRKNYNMWVENNWLQLSHNYNKMNFTSSFDEFCLYVHKGLEVGAWLPVEYTYKVSSI